jgi:hypothetical protein
MKSLDERTWAFVVKVWEERRDIDGAGPTWRASVDDVRRGTRVYFRSLPELSAYLQSSTGMSPPALAPPDATPPNCPARRVDGARNARRPSRR